MKKTVKLVISLLLCCIISTATVFARSIVSGFYSGFGSNGQLTSARVRVADDGIFVTSFGQTIYMNKMAPDIYVNQMGFRCVFDGGDMMFQNADGVVFYLQKTDN